jgi:nitrate reductase NapE component
MIEHDFDEDFVPIAAELQRLPYLSPSRDFADRVISGIDRLQPARVAPVLASRQLELHQGGRQAVVPRRPLTLVRGAGKAVAGVALITVAAFMFLEVDVFTAILSAAATQYAFAIAAVGTQVGAVVLGPETIAYLQTSAVQAAVLYITLVVGLVGGYGAIRTAAQIAKRKAA